LIIRALRLTGLTLHLLLGLLLLSLLLPLLPEARRAAIRMWWSDRLIRLLGIHLRVVGVTPAQHGVLFAANHVSWLDPFLLLARHPAHFVAKAEIRSWPVLGWLAAQSGTVFIERQRSRDTGRVMRALVALLQRGDDVGLFPEATTSDGTTLYPFKPSLLQAAADSGAALCPVGVRYVNPDGSRNLETLFIGETGLLHSLWAVSGARGIVAELHYCPLIDAAGHDRRELAQLAETAIASALHLPVQRTPPEIPGDRPAAAR
jgi:1-acyl-sn-glycerol-3-phosphate acyltransferase